MQQSQYTVLQTEDSQFVCAEVLSGDVAGREIEIDYSVEDSGTCSLLQLMILLYISFHFVHR